MSLLLVLSGCIIFDTSPAQQRMRELTDDDGDGSTLDEGDCNDFDPLVFPGAPERCDDLDNDCDETVDEDGGDVVWCVDADGDGHGDAATIGNACVLPANAVVTCDDCEDGNRSVHPNGVELCNGLDDDCDGLTDQADAADAQVWYFDGDLDGYGVSVPYTTGCDLPVGYSDNAEDCDDGEATVHPGATEECNNGVDDNCDGGPDGCGVVGTRILEAGSVDPRDSGYVDGPIGYSEGLGLEAYLQDTLGDGTADAMLAGWGDMYEERGGGSLHIWYSEPLGPQTVDSAAGHLYAPAPLVMASYPNSILTTDVDGDGALELLITALGSASGFSATGQVLRIQAGWTGTREVTPDEVFLVGGIDGEAFGTGLQRADGLAGGQPALLVGAPDYSAFAPSGGREFLIPLPSGTISDPIATIFGTSEDEIIGDHPLPLGDLNNDGIDDIAFNCEDASPSGAVYILHGPLAGDYLIDDADAVITDPDYAVVGESATMFPDLTGDGRSDLVIATAGMWHVGSETAMVLDGAGEGALTMRDHALLVLEGVAGSDNEFQLSRGDINGDDVFDLLVGSPYVDPDDAVANSGALYVLAAPLEYTGVQPILDRSDAVFYGSTAAGHLGSAIAAGDANGDGADDLLVADDAAEGSGGAWFLYGQGL